VAWMNRRLKMNGPVFVKMWGVICGFKDF